MIMSGLITSGSVLSKTAIFPKETTRDTLSEAVVSHTLALPVFLNLVRALSRVRAHTCFLSFFLFLSRFIVVPRFVSLSLSFSQILSLSLFQSANLIKHEHMLLENQTKTIVSKQACSLAKQSNHLPHADGYFPHRNSIIIFLQLLLLLVKSISGPRPLPNALMTCSLPNTPPAPL